MKKVLSLLLAASLIFLPACAESVDTLAIYEQAFEDGYSAAISEIETVNESEQDAKLQESYDLGYAKAQEELEGEFKARLEKEIALLEDEQATIVTDSTVNTENPAGSAPKAEVKAVVEPIPEPEAEIPVPTVEEQPAPTISRTVLVTKTGEKYHLKKCGNGNFFEDTLESAENRGLTPCSKCF